MTTFVEAPPEVIDGGTPALLPMGAKSFVESLPGYDPAYEIVHFAEWSDHEEWGWMAVLRRDGDLFLMNGGHSVMDPSAQEDAFDPRPTSDEEALDEMIDWEIHETPGFHLAD